MEFPPIREKSPRQQARQLEKIIRGAHIIMAANEKGSITSFEVRGLLNASSATSELYIRNLINAGALFKIGPVNHPEYSTDINREPRKSHDVGPSKGREVSLVAVDQRMQAIHDYIAQRTLDGDLPIRPAEIYWKFLISSSTGRADLSILEECHEIIKEGPTTRPTLRWNPELVVEEFHSSSQ